MRITVGELWYDAITDYPQKLIYYNKQTKEAGELTAKSDMDEFMYANADKEIVDFEISTSEREGFVLDIIIAEQWNRRAGEDGEE